MWLWLIQRDLECIYTFANVPVALLYYPNFYGKHRLSAIWWPIDFWGFTCLCYNWYPVQVWEKIYLRLLEGFLLQNSRKCTFLRFLQWQLASFLPPLSLWSHWFTVSAAVWKQKCLFFCVFTKITRQMTPCYVNL